MSAIPLMLVRSLLALALVLFTVSAAREQAPSPPPTATARIVRAANAFLATLSPQQRKSVLFTYGDAEQQARWSNFPTGFVRRAGISLGELTPAQRSAARTLMLSALSRRGFEKVQQIMDGDEALRVSEGDNPMFGSDLYYLSFLGMPSEKSPWMLQFGGHHLALNLTIYGDQGVLTPSLTGAQPALYTVNGKTVRPLGQESDKALALLNSLSASQKSRAVLNYQVADLVLGPGQDGRTILPEGLKASAMTDKQRVMLLDLTAEWAGIIHESAAAARMAEIKAGLSETWFAWSGPVTAQPGRNITAYYRIQGPKLVIEYAPQRLGGDLSQHVHTIYRDPTNDYGRRLTAK